MIELIAAAPVVGLVLAGAACLLYLGFAKVWVTRAAREGAVCLQTQMSKEKCRSRVEQTIRAGLPIGEATLDEFKKFAGLARVHIVFRIRKPDGDEPADAGLVEATVAIRDLK